MSTTPFVETEALLAVMQDDAEHLADLLDDMLPGERAALALAAQRLAESARIGKPSFGVIRALLDR